MKKGDVIKKRRFTRRSFIRGAGGLAVGLPFLSTGLPGSEAFGQDMAPGAHPKRVVFMFHPNGVIADGWFPTLGSSGKETDFSLNAVHKSLEPFKSKLVMMQNVDMQVGGVGPGGMHQQGMGGLLTNRPLNSGTFRGNAGLLAGYASGISIDQYIANRVAGDTPYKSLELGIRGDHHAGAEVMTRLSYLGSDQPLPPQNDPVEVFKALFSDQMTQPGTLDTLNVRRQSVLDSVKDQFSSLSTRVGYEDRIRLENHQFLMRDLERRIQAEGGGQCGVPDAPLDLDPDSKENMEAVTRNQLDLLAVALSCDITRVASFQFSNAWNKLLFPWIGSNVEGHTLSHAGPSNQTYNEQWIKRTEWYAEQLSYFLARLDSIPEGDGTLLDNTVIVWTSEVSRGNTHSWRDMPIMLAGSAGNTWETGRYLTYTSPQPMANLYVSLLNVFGIEEQTFGDDRFCTGTLSGLV